MTNPKTADLDGGAQRVDLPKYRPGEGDSASASGVSGAASFLLEFKSSEHEGMFSRRDRGGGTEGRVFVKPMMEARGHTGYLTFARLAPRSAGDVKPKRE